MSDFESALNSEVTQPHLFTANRSGRLLDGFFDMVKRAIAAAGFGDLTREEFIALVVKMFRRFATSTGLPPMLVALFEPLVEVIAGNIWDKRHPPVPAV